MAKGDSDALAEAIDETEKELFERAYSGNGDAQDASGDRSLENLDETISDLADETEVETVEAGVSEEGENAVEVVDAETTQNKDPVTGQFVKAAEKPEVDTKTDGRVPSAVVRERTEKANARVAAVEAELTAERNARAEDKRERDAIRAQMDLLARQVAQRQQPEVKPPAPAVRPDKFADPDGYDLWVENQIAAARNGAHEDFTKRMVNMNLAATRETHGDKFDAAFQGILTAAQSEPEARIAIQKIWNSDNPGAELLRWHRNRETLNEVGPDPEAYKQKLRDETRAALLADPEVRKEILASLKTEAAGNNGNNAPRQVTRLPKSLNSASGSAHVNADFIDDPSDQGAFNRAYRVQSD